MIGAAIAIFVNIRLSVTKIVKNIFCFMEITSVFLGIKLMRYIYLMV